MSFVIVICIILNPANDLQINATNPLFNLKYIKIRPRQGFFTAAFPNALAYRAGLRFNISS